MAIYPRGFVKGQSSSRSGRGRTRNYQKKRTKQERWPMQALSIPFIEGIFLPRSKKTRPSSRSRVYFCTTGTLGSVHLPTQTNRPQLSTSFLIKTEHLGSPGEVCNLKWLITPKIQVIGNGGKSSIPERKPSVNSLEAEIKN